MIIILEGPDLAGKTTLARELEAYLTRWYAHETVELEHRGPPKVHPLSEYELGLVNSSAHNIICDRWHLGELVYGPILRGKSRLDDPMIEHVHLLLQSLGAYVVVCQPSLSVLLERLDERGDGLIDRTQLVAVHRAYEQLLRERPHYVDRVMTTSTPSEDVAAIILAAERRSYEVAQFRRSAGWSLALQSYVGPTEPSALFVGDVRNELGAIEFPSAFVPFPSTSGHYLLRALTDAARLDFGYGLMNANERGVGPRDLYHAWSRLGRPSVVALGNNAHDTLTAADVPHGVVPHPQFVRRFHHARVAEYGRLIYLALDTQSDQRAALAETTET